MTSWLDDLAARQWRAERLLKRCGCPASLRRRILCRHYRRSAPPAVQAQARLFVEFLGEPGHRALSLAAEWLYYRAGMRSAWLGCSSPREVAVADVGAVSETLQDRRGGLVIAALHTGDYLQALTGLGRCLGGQTLHLIRRSRDPARDARAFRRFAAAGIRTESIGHGSGAARAALRILRRGGIVALLYDLPPRWGRSARVRLFGAPARMVVGPVALARAGNARILPVHNGFDRGRRLLVRAGPLLEPGRQPHLLDPVSTTLQQLASFAERGIRRQPEQWHHWHLLPEFFAPGPQALPEPSA
ncbi:MAG: hypothetical protein R3E86_07965 [Pseudomonadales bacterium]